MTFEPALLWSSLVSPPRGTTEISCIHFIERGYENLVGKLRGVGADIQIVNQSDDEAAQDVG